MYSVDTILGHVNYLPAIENNNPTTDQHLVPFSDCCAERKWSNTEKIFEDRKSL